MSNGFVQRFKGKISAASLWLGGTQQFGPGAVGVYSTNSVASTAGILISGAGASNTINASSAISIFALNFPPVQGSEFELGLINVSSGVFIKASPGTSFDPSTNTVIKSTYAMMITLVGLSTLKWGIKSVFPPPSTLVGGSGLTLSTTT